MQSQKQGKVDEQIHDINAENSSEAENSSNQNSSGSATKTADEAQTRNFQTPDELREFPNGRLELNNVGGSIIGRAVLEPGWRWSNDLKPIADTESCLAPHLQYHVKGIMHVVMDDGTEFECHPGDVSYLPPGHDAWTVGDEPVEVIDFHGMLDFALSKQKQAENGLKRLVLASPLPMLTVDASDAINSLTINPRLQEKVPYDEKTLTRDLASWAKHVFPDDQYRTRVMERWDELSRQSLDSNAEVPPLPVQIQNADGETNAFDIHLTKTGSQTIAVFVDTTEQKKITENLSHAAHHDELTGILNRRGYELEITRIWEQSRFLRQPCGLIIIDIDYFKQYNDNNGHAEGDACLVSVARALDKVTTETSSVFARLGGEEFGILVPRADHQTIATLAETCRKLVQSLAIKHKHSEIADVVTVSLGFAIAEPRSPDQSPEQLFRCADEQLYQAKEKGRNQVCPAS